MHVLLVDVYMYVYMYSYYDHVPHHMAGLHMCANSPMTWEIVYTVMCGLAYVS